MPDASSSQFDSTANKRGSSDREVEVIARNLKNFYSSDLEDPQQAYQCVSCGDNCINPVGTDAVYNELCIECLAATIVQGNAKAVCRARWYR